jgi:ABC-type nitrate/sulfonate/bicarbonate transport system permease component
MNQPPAHDRRFRYFPDFFRRNESTLLAIGAMLVFLLLWELLPDIGLANPFFTSSPSRIVVAGLWLFAHGFWNDILVSLGEFAIGMALAILFSIPLGLLLGWYHRMNAAFEPFVTMFNAMPRVALIPLIILWLGIGTQSKVAAVFLGAFFPLVINVMAGVKTVDETLLKCARSFGATDRQVFKTLALPTCVPFLVAGMRLALGRGLVGVVVGEMLASTAGVGHMMALASSTFQMDKMFVGLILLAGFGYFLTVLLTRLEKRFESWRP